MKKDTTCDDCVTKSDKAGLLRKRFQDFLKKSKNVYPFWTERAIERIIKKVNNKGRFLSLKHSTQLGHEAINKSFKFLKEAMRPKKQYLLVQPNPDDT